MKKGYTLTELIVILGLFATILLLGLTFLVNANKNFNRSRENSEMYYQARRVSDTIRDEIRYANTINLINVGDIDDTSENSYLFIRPIADGLGELVLQYKTDETIISSQIIVTPVNFILIEDSNGNNTLNYTITSRIYNQVGNREYSVLTTVLLNNIKMRGADSGVCIEFTKPSP